MISASFPNLSPPRWRKLYGSTILSYAHLSQVDPVTRRWIRNASDERAACTLIDGKPIYRYSEKIGTAVIDWMQSNCVLYEGDKGGQFIVFEDWQYEAIMQIFGWMYNSKDHKKWIRRFRQAGVWIPKKNAKSPTLACIGTFLFCGEGEFGQKCYSVARDGEQALIAHKHALNMIEQSPTLITECSINRTTKTITHRPTKSEYQVLHGKNTRSQEGLNGSILVDEVHVVDQVLMDIISRAGISRVQPLHAEFSTAGDNNAGYGRNRYDLGKVFAAAKTDADYNPRFYFMDYSIPQDTPIESLTDIKQTIKLAIRANPGINRLFPREEIEADLKESIRSPSKLARFAMYRLGKWATSGVSWISVDDWINCTIPTVIPLEELRSYPCVAGVDLANARDMVGVTLEWNFFYNGEPYPYSKTYHWITQSAIERYRGRVESDIFSDPYITIVDDKAIDHEVISEFLSTIRDDGQDIQGIGYDPWNSARLIDCLIKDKGWGSQQLISIPQSLTKISPHAKDLEQLILRQQMLHDPSKIMDWQWGHCCVYRDPLDNIAPRKPSSQTQDNSVDDPRKIDGIISLVIANAVSVDAQVGFRSIGDYFTAVTGD